MDKLPNAPLLEVIFELRWNMSNDNHWSQFPFLPGDLYALLKKQYPERHILAPTDIPPNLLEGSAIYRYSTKNGYPMVQLGPGVLSLNTTDDYYDWKSYSKNIDELLRKFNDVYIFSENEQGRATLSYYDFLEFDWDEEDILSYLRNKLKIAMTPQFYEFGNAPLALGVALSYKTDKGVFNLKIGRGTADNDRSGLILEFQIVSPSIRPIPEEVNKWLEEGHDLCSEMFKKITEGELYDSFK